MQNVYQNKKAFVTGNTGFKGSWLTAVLQHIGADVEGYALPPETSPNHFSLLNSSYATSFANILDSELLDAAVAKARPDIIFHLAAQPLVRRSYLDPVETYQTNVIGSLNILEAARKCASVKAIVLVTTDKVYENKERQQPYEETDELGGYDMYSSSKACCEILVRSYRNSFLNTADYNTKHHILVASARSGNVIGGGDWSADRLIPDIVKAASDKRQVLIRNPLSVRPWQHVLDCVYGYLQLGAKLLSGETEFADAWNFAPNINDIKNVQEIAALAHGIWNRIDIGFASPGDDFHEAGLLLLNNSKAVSKLNWQPLWNTSTAIQKAIEWYRAYYEEIQVLTGEHIESYLQNFKN
jgi:CDP-glucose 4,6-dehydratase